MPWFSMYGMHVRMLVKATSLPFTSLSAVPARKSAVEMKWVYTCQSIARVVLMD